MSWPIASEAQLLTREALAQLRRRAIRFKAWFKLDRLERAAIDLTIRVVDRVRSSVLARVILGIVDKLRQWLRPTLRERALAIGRPLAEKISKIAQSWGNHRAGAWVEDLDFAFYLGISWINTPTVYRAPP